MVCESALQVGGIYFFLKYIKNFNLLSENGTLKCFISRGVFFKKIKKFLKLLKKWGV